MLGTPVTQFLQGTLSAAGASISGELDLTGEQTFSTTGTSNDVTVNAGVSTFRYTGSGTATITGFTGGAPGRMLLVINEAASVTMQLSVENAGSVAANRLSYATTVLIPAQSCCLLRYNGSLSRWQCIASSAYQWQGSIQTSGSLSVGQGLNLSGTATATALTVATTNDWSIGSANFKQRISSTLAATVTGIVQPAAGRVLWLQNSGSYNFTFSHESASSTAANRFQCPNSVDLVVPPNASVVLVYDNSATRWVLHGGLGCYSQASNTLLGSYSPSWQSSRYYFAPNCTLTTSAALGNTSLRAMPFYVPNAVTVTRLGAEVTTIGDVGSKVRLGIYADDGTFRPGNLIVDAGQIAGDSASVQEITGLSTTIGPGWYWAAAAVQSAPTTQPTVRTVSTLIGGFYPDAGTTLPAAGTNGYGFLSGTATAGALPSSFGTPTLTTVAARLIIKT